MDYRERYLQWMNSPYFDEAIKTELRSIENDDKEIQERFYKDLEFGTGGLRGIIGAGTNRMNKYTIRKATQGLANYILMQGEEGKSMGVAIAYDSRYMSPEFAEQAALVLNGNGIKAYVFDELRPTPELSFAVRELGCIAGIVVTASHNPPEYNGYKVYWSDGGQVPYPRDEEIITEVDKVEDYSSVKVMERAEAEGAGLYQVIGSEMDDRYIASVKGQSINGELIQKKSDDFTIVFTPLHGTGNKPVRRVLQEVGFKNVWVVPEQEKPDAKFSTVEYPNPEDPKAFALAIELAKEKDADVIIGTDPDADRVGVLAKNPAGEYVVLTGNMTGVLLAEYILSQKKSRGELPRNGAIIKTIVTTEMARMIANAYDTALIEVLTGFKYIGEKIKLFEETNEHTYLFGFEESYGYLAGTYARDKDAVVAAMLACEMAAFYKAQGLTLFEALQNLYEKYGFYKETLKSLTLKGIEGVEKIRGILKALRQDAPTEFAGVPVVEARDYQSQTIQYVRSHTEDRIHLPKSDVLYFALEDGSWFCIRPSGTEPKVKLYFGVKGENESQATAKLTALSEAVMEKVNTML